MNVIKSLRRLAYSLKTATIKNQEIYDFYAIVGSLTQDYFEDYIDDLAVKIDVEFRNVIIDNVDGGFRGTFGVPSLNQWQSWGGSKLLYDKLYKAYDVELYDVQNLPNRIQYRYDTKQFSLEDFVGDIQNYEVDLSDLDLSDDEVDQLYSILRKRPDQAFRTGQTWGKTWEDFKKYSKRLYDSDISKKVVAIDSILGLAHHNGSLLDYVGEITEISGIREQIGEQALNAKFNARTPADFWDKVSPQLCIEINKIRRSELQLPIITFNEERSSDLFTYNYHKEEKDKKILEEMNPVSFLLLRDSQNQARELGFSEEWIQEKINEGQRRRDQGLWS